MSDEIEKYFIRMNQHNKDRKEMLQKWRDHHQHCLDKITEELEAIDLLPASYEDLVRKYK